MKKDEAVSPVIAVILMVAITVVLAAIVYVWVSGFSDENMTPRTMSVRTSGGNETHAVYLVTGASASLEWDDLGFTLDGASASEEIPEGSVDAGDSFTVSHPDGISGMELVITDEPANAVIMTLKIR